MTRFYSARIDENQPDLVAFLRKAGASVQLLSKVGQGCPDLLVGYLELTVAAEVKNPAKPRADQELTPAQVLWFKAWNGDKPWILKNESDCLELLAHMRKRAGKSILETQ